MVSQGPVTGDGDVFGGSSPGEDEQYRHLAGEVTGEAAPMGVTHMWLLDALDRSVA
jgi:hypothetical protein